MVKNVTFDSVVRDGANVWLKPDGKAEIELHYHLESPSGETMPRPARRFSVELDQVMTPDMPGSSTYNQAIKRLADDLMAVIASEELA